MTRAAWTVWCMLLLALAVAPVPAPTPTTTPVLRLIERLVPMYANQFVLTLLARTTPAEFTVHSGPCNVTTSLVCVHLSGTDGVALASAFNFYLRTYANCSVSWLGDQLGNLARFGRTLPPVHAPVRREAQYMRRYYMNPCTSGYSTFSWCVLK